MFVTLFILLFVAQPVKGPSGTVSVNAGTYNAEQQIETNQKEYANENSDYGRFRWRERHYCSEEFRKPHHENDGKDKWGTWMFIVTAIIAVGTVGMGFVIYLQYLKSRESSEKQLRAYIYIEPRPSGPNHMFGGVIIKNGGQTPAYNVSAWIKAGHCSLDKLCSVVLEKGTLAQFPPIHMSRDETFFLEPKEAPAFLDGSRPEDNDPMIYWGVVEYTDTFGNPHSTEFRFGSAWVRYDPFERDVWGITTVCPNGNDAT